MARLSTLGPLNKPLSATVSQRPCCRWLGPGCPDVVDGFAYREFHFHDGSVGAKLGQQFLDAVKPLVNGCGHPAR